MKFLNLFVIVALICSCNRNATAPATTVSTGVWVETSLRLDTLDFDSWTSLISSSSIPNIHFRSQPFNDPALASYTINLSNILSYHYKSSDTLSLRYYTSSSLMFNDNYFERINNNTFKIKDFINEMYCQQQ